MAISATDPSTVSATSRTAAIPQPDDAQATPAQTASLETASKTPAPDDVVNGARALMQGIGAQLQNQLNKPLEQDAGNGHPTKPCPRSKCTADGGPIRGLGGPTTEFA
ncbi:MAG TPA: hypothetical protein VGO62_16065 [Myxococcota bacterium]|jgi:hypothetical protein